MTADDLPVAELDIMTCLWQLGPATAREIRESLSKQRPMAHASVCTLLKRLEDKQLVEREKGPVGKAFIYRAAIAPTKTHRRLLKDMVDRVFSGNSLALVASLLETRPPTEQELEELQQLLDELKQKPASSHNKRRRS